MYSINVGSNDHNTVMTNTANHYHVVHIHHPDSKPCKRLQYKFERQNTSNQKNKSHSSFKINVSLFKTIIFLNCLIVCRLPMRSTIFMFLIGAANVYLQVRMVRLDVGYKSI